MMRNVFFLFCASALQGAAFSNEEKSCERLPLIDDEYYDEEILKTDIYKPSSLAVDYKTNTLYFSHISKPADDTYKTAKVNLNTKEYVLLDVNNGFSNAVDQKNHEVYIGGYKGVYKYDESRNEARPIVGGTNVWDIFYKDVLYYIEFISQTLYTYVDGKSAPVIDLAGTKVFYFALDNDDYMLYSNGTGLYGQKKDTIDTVTYKELKSVDEIRDIAIDKNGRAFVCFADGIYEVFKAFKSLEKVVDIEGAYGVTFDADNQMIYSTESALIRLVPSKRCEYLKTIS